MNEAHACGRPTVAKINLNNLKFNFLSVKKFVGENLKYMAVVKANAYGHCAVECAKTLESSGVDCFGVALPEEGAELRKAGINLSGFARFCKLLKRARLTLLR